MNEELKIIIKAVTTDAQKSMQEVKKELQGIAKEAKSTSDKFGTAMRGIARATTIAITAIMAVIAAIVGLGKSTLDTQKQLAQLEAAFGAAGKSAAEAASVYTDFYRFLGDADTAVEASNLLIKLTQDEKNLAEWTKILQGVYATFPDSLPIEGLVESANETARVGQVTGNLADALNWAGVSEDAFNQKLAQTSSLEEREALIRNTLNNLYGRAAEIYEQNNKSLLEYNESQANLQRNMAELGRTVTPLLTALNNLASAVVAILKPAFENVLPYIVGFVLWLTEALNRTFELTSALAGVDSVTESVGTSLNNSFSQVNNTLDEQKEKIEEIKRSVLGFDELNIVPSNKTDSSSTGGTGGLGGIDTGVSSGVANLAGSLEEFRKKAENVKNEINEWMDKWGWALQGIAAVLAALTVRHLILQFGELIGLAETFKKALSFTGITTALAEFAGWLGAVIALLREGNSFWAVMGAAFPKAEATILAIGSAFSKVGTAIAGAAKAAAAFIGGLSASTIAIIVAAVAALASGVYFLWENWDAVVQKVKEFTDSNLIPIIDEIKGHFAGLWGALQELGAAFVNVGASIWNALPKGLQDWLYGIWEGIKQVVKAIGEWFASMEWLKAIGTAIEGLGAIVVGILGGVIAGAIQALLNLIESVVQIVTGAIQVISGILSTFANLITGIFTGDFSKCKDSVELIWEGIKNIFKGAVDAVIGTVWGFIQGVIDWFKHMWDVLVGHSIVPDTIEAIIDWFAYLPVRVFKLVEDFVKGVIDFFADLATKLGEWAETTWKNISKPFENAPKWFSEKFTAAKENTQNAFKSIGNWFGDRWRDTQNALSNVGQWFGDTYTAARTNVNNAFNNVGSWFGDRCADIRGAFKDIGSWFHSTFTLAYGKTTNAFSRAKSGFANVWSNMRAGFGNVSEWFETTFHTAWTKVKNVFSKGGKVFDGIKDGILEGLKAVINHLIDGINRVITIPFNGINSALSGIRDVSIAGVEPFKWLPYISVPQIPKLARGGIVDQATLALIGERGKEAVVPLENNTEWMDKLVDKLISRRDTPTKIVLMLDGRELGWANINSINNITRQTGSLPLVLA